MLQCFLLDIDQRIFISLVLHKKIENMKSVFRHYYYTTELLLFSKPPETDSKKAPGQPTDVTREKLSIANNLEQNEPEGIILANHP